MPLFLWLVKEMLMAHAEGGGEQRSVGDRRTEEHKEGSRTKRVLTGDCCEEVEWDGLADLGPDYEYSVVGELAAYHYIFLWSQIS